MGRLLHLVQRGGDWVGPQPARPLLAVPNVTAHPSTASVPTSYWSMWHYNCLWSLKGQTLIKHCGTVIAVYWVKLNWVCLLGLHWIAECVRLRIARWVRAVKADLGPLNFGLATAWRQATTQDEWRHIVNTATLQWSTLWKKERWMCNVKS